ncbi:MAG: adenosylcobinamide amidohydrolase [Candidatus Binatia bacterium]
MNNSLMMRVEPDAFIVTFAAPARALSWSVLNGGMRHANHIVNFHVPGNDAAFCAEPERWLERAVLKLGLNGKVVGMATAVPIKDLIQVSVSSGPAEVKCFATVGCGNALSVGDPASVTLQGPARSPLHTINMILAVQPGLADEAMVEAIQIVTEGRVRALYEAGIRSSASNLVATGTGTDCIAIVSLGRGGERYCGKHTQLGELIGRAAYSAVRKGLVQASSKNGAAPEGKYNDK